MKVYISGQMSGFDDHNFPAFFKKEKELLELGHEVVNPARCELSAEGNSWEDFMKADIRNMMDCDAICMLNGWANSRGAKIELYIALQLGFEIFDSNMNNMLIVANTQFSDPKYLWNPDLCDLEVSGYHTDIDYLNVI